MTTDDVTAALSPSLPQMLATLAARNLAHHLEHASVTELADLVSALAGECSARGFQVAEPLGLVAARLEYYREVER